MVIEPIRVSVTVALAPGAAFARFTEAMTDWWPHEYTWSGEVLEELGIEPWVDGMCYETGPYGFRCDWGRVLAWDRPSRLAFTWQIGPAREPVPDARKASEVEVRFTPDGGGTRVELAHKNLERHGESAAGYRESLASPQGWPYILQRFASLPR